MQSIRVLLLVALLGLLIAGCGSGSGQRSAEPKLKSPNEYAWVNGAPTLIEIGSDTCIPCKEMAPILARTAASLEGRVNVRVVDIYKEPTKAKSFQIRVIPTQIFLDGKGAEVARHEGVLPYEAILQQFAAMGVK